LGDAVEVIRADGLAGLPHGFLGRRGGVSTGTIAGLNIGHGAEDDAAAVRDALERVAMANFASAQIGALSGGQQQRVFLARALVQEASVLLLDEPMTGVDQTTEQLIIGLLKELRDGGTTILQATHDLESAAEISDQLCFVNRRVVAYGPPAETFTPSILHATFGGELLIVQAGDHSHVHGGGHHGPAEQ